MAIDLSGGLAVYSPDYFPPVEGGDISPTGEGILTFPEIDASYVPIGPYGQGPDGSTGDSSDTSHLWSTLGGVAGSFLRAFSGGTGNIGINATGTLRTCPDGTRVDATKACPATPGVSSQGMMYLLAGLAALIVVILIVRK